MSPYCHAGSFPGGSRQAARCGSDYQASPLEVNMAVVLPAKMAGIAQKEAHWPRILHMMIRHYSSPSMIASTSANGLHPFNRWVLFRHDMLYLSGIRDGTFPTNSFHKIHECWHSRDEIAPNEICCKCSILHHEQKLYLTDANFVPFKLPPIHDTSFRIILTIPHPMKEKT